MNSKRTILTITILAALITVAAMWTMSWADDASPATERELNFTSVGISEGQTARLNVSNLGGEPMMAQFFVFDEKGVNQLPLSEITVEPGHTASMDLPYEAAPTTGGRRQIRGMIKVTSRSGQITDGTAVYGAITDGTITASMEIFDSRTGKTVIGLSLGQLGTHNYHSYVGAPAPQSAR